LRAGLERFALEPLGKAAPREHARQQVLTVRPYPDLQLSSAANKEHPVARRAKPAGSRQMHGVLGGG